MEQRILITLKWFDLQGIPLTLLELHKFLLPPSESLISPEGSLKISPNSLSEVQTDLQNLLNAGSVEEFQGYYFLKGKQALVLERMQNYANGIKRERRIDRYLHFTRHIPFIRGIGIGGSQALGVQHKDSDIDLLVVCDRRYMWIARTLLTLYFQIFGVRRHGEVIPDRFCLNHYVGGVKHLNKDLNLFTATEYGRLRPVVYPIIIDAFQTVNLKWMSRYFPNLPLYFDRMAPSFEPSSFQQFFEKILRSRFGRWLDDKLSKWQLSRIERDDYILVEPDELSFHHPGKQKRLQREFYNFLKSLEGPKIEVVSVAETLIVETE